MGLIFTLSLELSPDLNDYFQLTKLPEVFISKFIIILVLNIVGVWIYEKIVGYFFK
jgi:hypothetical protein